MQMCWMRLCGQTPTPLHSTHLLYCRPCLHTLEPPSSGMMPAGAGCANVSGGQSSAKSIGCVLPSIAPLAPCSPSLSPPQLRSIWCPRVPSGLRAEQKHTSVLKPLGNSIAHPVTGIWYSGIMLASGARGPGFDSRNPPFGTNGPWAFSRVAVRLTSNHPLQRSMIVAEYFCQIYLVRPARASLLIVFCWWLVVGCRGRPRGFRPPEGRGMVFWFPVLTLFLGQQASHTAVNWVVGGVGPPALAAATLALSWERLVPACEERLLPASAPRNRPRRGSMTAPGKVQRSNHWSTYIHVLCAGLQLIACRKTGNKRARS